MRKGMLLRAAVIAATVSLTTALAASPAAADDPFDYWSGPYSTNAECQESRSFPHQGWWYGPCLYKTPPNFPEAGYYFHAVLI